MVPFEHPQKEAAFTAAKRVVDAFGGLRGYVGVDVILSGERVFVVDVNARLTTSYVGLRKVAGFNVGAALVDAVLERKMPQRAGTKGAACFTKVQTVTPASQVYEEAVKSKGVVSPPFPLEGDGEACGLVLGEGATPEVAAASLEEAKKHLCTLVC
jgi:formate-dependent phosphoribosylglycinamide formyltransferase (GAR transformylase)